MIFKLIPKQKNRALKDLDHLLLAGRFFSNPNSQVILSLAPFDTFHANAPVSAVNNIFYQSSAGERNAHQITEHVIVVRGRTGGVGFGFKFTIISIGVAISP